MELFGLGKSMSLRIIKREPLKTKTLQIMKLTAVILLVACLQVNAKGIAQQTVTLSKKNATLESIFKEVRKQTGFDFFYDDAWLEKAKKVNISVKNAPLSEVLDICFKDQELTYSIKGKNIYIEPKPEISRTHTASELPVPPIDVTGRIVNEDGEPVVGASINVKGDRTKGTTTDANGTFQLKGIEETAVLVISAVNIVTREIALNGRTNLTTITVRRQVTQGEEVVVTANTGYQQIPRERATGSFDIVDNKLINRSVSTDILSRLENLTPGLLFNRGDAAKTDPFLIRGRSTIFADAQPMIVIDNFPYDGDLGNINPNDIETITILKDAAAASIWGARAGNGVIVITTKRGRTSKPRVELNTNITWQGKPDLFNVSKISSADFVELEKFLYTKGYYNSSFTSSSKPPLTPVVELLRAKALGSIPAAEADAQIEALKQFDVRNDLQEYFYQTTINQQHAVNVSGNTPFVNYYMSAGYDKNLSSLVGQQYDRISLRTQNTFKVSEHFQIDAGINYLQSINKSGNNPGYNYTSIRQVKFFYPYARLADENGAALPIYADYRKGFIDTAGQGKLLDWVYKPLDDIDNHDNRMKLRDYVLNLGIRYRINKYIGVEARYQYENQLITNNNLRDEDSYFARDYVNKFTQINFSTSEVIYKVPKGGILDVQNRELTSHQARAQINFNKTWSSRHEVAAIAGWELRSLVTTTNQHRSYAYSKELSQVSNTIDYASLFPYYGVTGSNRIDGFQFISKLTDHFLSYYANAAYTLDKRYIISLSGRIDQANLFGVKTNQKGTPLWSLGGSWIASNEDFYDLRWLPFLKLRTTYGYNGNISRKTSAETVIRSSTSSQTTPLPSAEILNPPNADLRWERVGIINLGLDFEIKNKILFGSIEFYNKKGRDLIGQAPVDPTLGVGSIDNPSVYVNVAGMKGKGVDLELNSTNINGKFIKWYSTLIFSYSSSEVSEYLLPVSTSGRNYLIPNVINPVEGRPLFSVYSFRWAGLDPTNGDPQGYFDGAMSKSYGSIYNSTPLDSLLFHGSVQPTSFGALRNTVMVGNLSLSFNISFKFNYFFRVSSIHYGGTFSNWTGHGDYAMRWQKAGDETSTNVPSLVYPANTNRENFYTYSEVLVEKADNIRLEDITLSYELDKKRFQKLPFSYARLYLYSSNLGMLWSANKKDIDPYYNNVPLNGKRFAIGINVSF